MVAGLLNLPDLVDLPLNIFGGCIPTPAAGAVAQRLLRLPQRQTLLFSVPGGTEVQQLGSILAACTLLSEIVDFPSVNYSMHERWYGHSALYISHPQVVWVYKPWPTNTWTLLIACHVSHRYSWMLPTSPRHTA